MDHPQWPQTESELKFDYSTDSLRIWTPTSYRYVLKLFKRGQPHITLVFQLANTTGIHVLLVSLTFPHSVNNRKTMIREGYTHTIIISTPQWQLIPHYTSIIQYERKRVPLAPKGCLDQREQHLIGWPEELIKWRIRVQVVFKSFKNLLLFPPLS